MLYAFQLTKCSYFGINISMDKLKRNNLIGQGLLLIATLAWGTSFVVLKETINELPAIFVVAIRFLACGIIGSLIFIKKIIKLDKASFVNGLTLGVILSLAYLTQTYGLKHTSPGQNAFLTSSYCVMCPFLLWIIKKIKPQSHHVVSAIACVIGIGLIALCTDTSVGASPILGNGLTLIAAVFFGLQIIFIDSFCSKNCDTVKLLIVELFSVGVILFAFSLIFEFPSLTQETLVIDKPNLLNIIYLTFVCTLLPQSAQMFGQKLATSPTQTAIILSLEAVFGVLFSILNGSEDLSLPLVIGFVLIFVAILICELKIDIFKPFKKLFSRNKL